MEIDPHTIEGGASRGGGVRAEARGERRPVARPARDGARQMIRAVRLREEE